MLKRKALTRRQIEDELASAIAQLERLLPEYKGALLVNYVLTQRLGGEVEITQEEMMAAKGGRLRTGVDRNREVWLFQAVPPEPAEFATDGEAGKDGEAE